MQPIALKYAKTITNQNMLEASLQQEMGRANTTRARAVDYDTRRLFPFAHEFQRIGESAQTGDCDGMLFSMYNRDIHCPRKMIGHSKTMGRCDTTQAEATEGWPNRNACSNDLPNILSIQADGKSIHTTKSL